MKIYFIVLSICLYSICSLSCQMPKDKSTSTEDLVEAQQDNQENKASHISGWHTYNSDVLDPSWQIDEDGVISFDKSRGKGGDMITDKTYEDFELSLEWKISECGNSGVFWSVVESNDYRWPWQTGPEMQILDNSCHPDGKIKTHRAGDLYDMIETSVVNVKPAGQWNTIKITSMQGNITFMQNGEQVAAFTMHDKSWDNMIANSKFKDIDSFGKARRGHIGLQDHNDKVWFRKINITEL